ncbi:MAG: hypothetical protein Q8M76_18335, partial [Spirochaetaceae bacterium]|nr:hypothetical protein [Spirochaetaceae bacterium]
ETFVYAELRKAIVAAGTNRAFYYYGDNAGTEGDFVVAGGGCRLIEAKWTETPRDDNLAGLKRLAALGEASGAPELALARGYVLCRTGTDYPLAGRPDGAGKDIQIEAVGPGSFGRILGL